MIMFLLSTKEIRKKGKKEKKREREPNTQQVARLRKHLFRVFNATSAIELGY